MPPPAPKRATAPPAARTPPGNGKPDPDVAMALADREDRRNGQHAPAIHRMLPQSAEAEIALLSATLILPRQVIDLCRDEGVTESTFHIPANATIWRAITKLDDAKKSIDVPTLTQALRDTKELDAIGGPAYVMDVAGNMPTAANTRQHIEILREKETLRDVIASQTEIVEAAYDEQDAAACVDSLEKSASRIAKNFAGNRSEITDMKTLVMESIERSDACRTGKRDSGISTGIPELDDATGGLSAFTAIAGKTSDGKTALGMTIAKHVAVELKKPVGIISLEMTRDELTERLIAMDAPCDLFEYINGRYADSEIDKLTAAISRISVAPIYIDDEHGIGIKRLCAKARSMRRKQKIEILFVDYFQLLSEDKKTGTRGNDESMTERLTQASQILKQLQKELEIPLVVLVQEDAHGNPKWAKAIQDDANNYFQIRHGEDDSNIHVWKQRSGSRYIDAATYFERKHVRFLPEHMRPPAPAKPQKKKK